MKGPDVTIRFGLEHTIDPQAEVPDLQRVADLQVEALQQGNFDQGTALSQGLGERLDRLYAEFAVEGIERIDRL